MAQIDDTITTYLTAIDVEGKTQNTVLSYRASLEDFRRVGRLGGSNPPPATSTHNEGRRLTGVVPLFRRPNLRTPSARARFRPVLARRDAPRRAQ